MQAQATEDERQSTAFYGYTNQACGRNPYIYSPPLLKRNTLRLWLVPLHDIHVAVSMPICLGIRVPPPESTVVKSIQFQGGRNAGLDFPLSC